MTLPDFEHESPAIRRVLGWLEQHAKRVRVSQRIDLDPARRELFQDARAIRRRLLDRGYSDRPVEPDLCRARGLASLEARLFRDDSPWLPPLEDFSGLSVIGAPQGEGHALFVAREIQARLNDGAQPDDLLILTRHWDEDAEIVVETLRSWGIPVATPGRPRSMTSDPAVGALLLAASIPGDGWEVLALARLMGHGLYCPEPRFRESPELPARAASFLRNAPVFRGKAAILDALDRAIDVANDEPSRRQANEVRELVVGVIRAIEEFESRATRRTFLNRLIRIADALGLAWSDRESGLAAYLAAVEEHVAIHEALGHATTPLDASRIVAEIESLAGDLSLRDVPERSGSVVVSTVEAAVGMVARHLVVVNLTEGTFPSRESVTLDVNQRTSNPEASDAAGSVPPDPVDSAFGREMDSFLGLLASAEESLVLTYPTRDEKGQEILAAGFLDDVLRSFSLEARARFHVSRPRLDPLLLDDRELAGGRVDQRVRAVGLASAHRDTEPLRTLASHPAHRVALEGSAIGLDLAQHRFFARHFDQYDGLLTDSAAAEAIAASFGPTYTFSPSQIESYLTCPFQFFLKYVLRLRSLELRDELIEDYTVRGSRIHAALEELERRVSREEGDRLDLAPIAVQTVMRVELTVDAETDEARRRIEEARLERTLRNYLVQARDYEERHGPAPRPIHFEVSFGDPRHTSSLPHLEIEREGQVVRLRGTVDRVDLVEGGDRPSFRVIDYKTGAVPTVGEVKSGFMVQLPLYAMAVERFLYGEGTAELGDLGYWSLRDGGYKPIRARWNELVEVVETQVIATVQRIRRAEFVVQPRRDDCTSHCDYKAVCRIAQTRSAGKSREGPPGQTVS